MFAEVIAIGDELTSGHRLDTNSQWLAERLCELGIVPLYHTTVGDDLAANVRVFRNAVERADVVVATGGLGPTADDLTREAVAQAAGVSLELDAASLTHIESMFARRNRPMPSTNQIQAMFPQGSRVVPNPHGTAPGIDLSIPRPGAGEARVFCLPGVPVEMREMWTATVAPAIAGLSGPKRQVIRHYRIKCFGVGESELEQMLPDLIRRGRDPMVGITVSAATITLRITAAAESETACQQKMAPTIATIHECLGDLVYGLEDDRLEQVVCRQLAAARSTVATWEVGTRGLVSWLLCDAAAEWMEAESAAELARGGGSADESAPITTVSRGGRLRPFAHGAVLADQVAAEGHDIGGMADQTRRDHGADFGLAVGGFTQDSIDIAVASSDGIERLRYSRAGHPDIVVKRAAKQALNALRMTLLRRERSRKPS
jgi:nicotinamide-nucleotide amidase